MNPDYTNFYHIDRYGKYNILSQLEDNMKSFFDTAFLNIGAFININKPTTEKLGKHQRKTGFGKKIQHILLDLQ